MIAYFDFFYLCVTGLHVIVYSYEVMKNCDLYGRAHGTHAMYGTGSRIWAEGIFKGAEEEEEIFPTDLHFVSELK